MSIRTVGRGTGRRAQSLERGLEDRLEVTRVAADRADGNDHIEDLLEREVVADLAALLGGDEEWATGGEDPRAASEARLRRFVADASHELRTPLASIRGHAELFSRGASERPAAWPGACGASKGGVSASSTLGAGTVVEVRLPLASAPRPSEATGVSSGASPAD